MADFCFLGGLKEGLKEGFVYKLVLFLFCFF